MTLATELLRVVVVDGVVVPDPERRLPGRGAWLHLDPDCLRAAERRKAFGRALRVPGQPDVTAVRTHVAQPFGSSTGGTEARAGKAGRPVMSQP